MAISVRDVMMYSSAHAFGGDRSFNACFGNRNAQRSPLISKFARSPSNFSLSFRCSKESAIRSVPANQGYSTADSSLVICFGEMLIDFVPTVAGVSLSEAPAFKKAPGGAPANVAVAISRLGGQSAFIGKIHGPSIN